jgi:hypothetical protein
MFHAKTVLFVVRSSLHAFRKCVSVIGRRATPWGSSSPTSQIPEDLPEGPGLVAADIATRPRRLKLRVVDCGADAGGRLKGVAEWIHMNR